MQNCFISILKPSYALVQWWKILNFKSSLTIHKFTLINLRGSSLTLHSDLNSLRAHNDVFNSRIILHGKFLIGVCLLSFIITVHSDCKGPHALT